MGELAKDKVDVGTFFVHFTFSILQMIVLLEMAQLFSSF